MGRGAKQVPEGRNVFHPAQTSNQIFPVCLLYRNIHPDINISISHFCLWEGQMSVLFLRRTRRYAADKPILIKEPACTRGSKAFPAGVAPPRPTSPRAQKGRAEAESILDCPPGSAHCQGCPGKPSSLTISDSSLSSKSLADFQHNGSASDGGCHFLSAEQDDLPPKAELVREYFLFSSVSQTTFSNSAALSHLFAS